MRPALLAARLLLELALLAVPLVAAVRAWGGWGWAAGVAAAAVVATVWGLLLSPRRHVDAPLGARVAVELALFAAAGVALAASGLPAWGAALVAAEVVVAGGLWASGLPPGTDVGGPA